MLRVLLIFGLIGRDPERRQQAGKGGAALANLSALVNGKRQIISDPPLIERLDDMIDLDPPTVRGGLVP